MKILSHAIRSLLLFIASILICNACSTWKPRPIRQILPAAHPVKGDVPLDPIYVTALSMKRVMVQAHLAPHFIQQLWLMLLTFHSPGQYFAFGIFDSE